jgi:peptide/nickel transport system substrate-binding protein
MAATGTYNNKDLKKLFLDAVKEPDQAKRGAMYKQAQSIIAQDLPIVPLIETTGMFVYASDITGHPQSPEGGKAGVSIFDYSLVKFK